MIFSALQCVVNQLNAFLKQGSVLNEEKAILGTILNEEGSVPEGNRNRVLLMMVNLEYESAMQSARAYVKGPASTPNSAANSGGQPHALRHINSPWNFNIDVLIAALFNNYNEALKHLSASVFFFQANNDFTQKNAPCLAPNIERLTFEIVKLSYTEAHNLWAALGTKYVPSFLLKMRMLSFQGSAGQEAFEVQAPELDTELAPHHHPLLARKGPANP